MKKLLNRETILYLIFGVLTTLVNYVLFWLGLKLFTERYTLIINVFCFLAAATFAYVTNKLFVFESKSWRMSVLKKEIPAFFAARIFSFGLEEFGLWLCKDVFRVGRYELVLRLGSHRLSVGGIMIAKIVLSVVVVLLNYVFSKLYIFRKSGGNAGDGAEPPADDESLPPEAK